MRQKQKVVRFSISLREGEYEEFVALAEKLRYSRSKLAEFLIVQELEAVRRERGSGGVGEWGSGGVGEWGSGGVGEWGSGGEREEGEDEDEHDG